MEISPVITDLSNISIHVHPSNNSLVTSSLDDLYSDVLKVLMPMVASLIAVFGVIGNLLTLGAIIYVRRTYPKEFTVLQLPVTDLLINLSVCDLVFCLFGLPHMIHGMVLGGHFSVTS